MRRAIGMCELKTVSTGVTAADLMVKTANVDILEAKVVCPGKYLVLIAGELSAVRASVDAAKVRFEEQMIDSFVLGNPHESLFGAIYGANEVENPEALGVLETFSASAAIVAADIAAKTALVSLIELRLARGMCGKSYLYLTGSVSAVQAAIERAEKEVGDYGMLLDSSVIPSPAPQMWESIL
ncbi:MAG: BMC domain-containing protein [Clostridia bacterium]|nr:BMC domain-containing protein [Clostridia bacterium]